MKVITVTESNFEQEVINSEIPVLIDFWASWCYPCSMMSPVIDEIAEEIANVKICKVNVDEESVLAEKFNISSIPALILIKNGNVLDTMIGVQSKETLLNRLKD